MDAPLYCDIFWQTLLPFLQNEFPEAISHWVNDPKHYSRSAQKFYDEVSVNRWCTPQELPNINPIENLWHEFLQWEIKPRSKQELVDGVSTLWTIVGAHKC